MFTLKASPREKEFFTYYLRGMSYKEISFIMGVKETQILALRDSLLTKNRYKNMYKMGFDYYANRVELLTERNAKLKHSLSEARGELRYYRNVLKRK